jgi:hypothetical protein
MSEPDLAAVPPRAPDHRVALGVTLTLLWLGLALAYLSFAVGWERFLALPPSELGSFLEGAIAPLAFLWLVLGLFLQQSEIARNNEALGQQSEALRKSAEQAEIQSRAIQANELHARQDTFVDLSRLVTRQIGVTAGLLYLSSQGAGAGGTVPAEQMREMWNQLGSGDDRAFMRALLSLRFTLPEREAFELYYGTPIRTRHCETVVRAFERLLRVAESCDPDGMIRDALLGDASGRLYQSMTAARANPPAGTQVVPSA